MIKRTTIKQLESNEDDPAEKRRKNRDKTGAIGFSYVKTMYGSIMPYRMEKKG